MRLEGIIAGSGKHPLYYEKNNELEIYKKLLITGISKISKYFNYIWIRTSDIRTDEFSTLKGAPEREINPMLGFHGVRFSLKYPNILKAELEAVKEIAENYPDKKFGIMFPQIISIDEVIECKKYFNEIKTDNMEFGVMIETPASVQIIEDISNEVDFISFGTNDLTQFTLAVDRGEDSVQYLYNELHPAIFSQIKKVIDVCRRKKVETSICGQAGSRKEMVEFLFRKGINSITVNADVAYDVSKLINQLDLEWKNRKEENLNYNNKFDNSKKYENSSKDQRVFKLNRKYHKDNKWDKKRKWNKWDKKGSFSADELFTDKNKRENNKDTQKFDNNISQYEKTENIDDNSGILNKKDIQYEAEINENYNDKSTQDTIESLDDLDRIEKRSEEITEKIRKDNIEKLENKYNDENKIKLENSNEIISDVNNENELEENFDVLDVYPENGNSDDTEKKKFKYDFE